MSKKYYKVVTYSLKSVWIYHLAFYRGEYKSLAVQYKVDEWVYPNPEFDGSKLMVFNCLKEAQRFAKVRNGYVYECEVKNPKPTGLFVTPHHTHLFKNLLNKLKLRKQHKKFNFISDGAILPSNTVFCDAVKLTQLIQ